MLPSPPPKVPPWLPLWLWLRLTLLAACLVPPSPIARGANWPAWRGPTADGIAAETNAPLKWSRSENVRWRTPLPTPGNSTPILWEDQLFLTASAGAKGTLLAFDRRNGRARWTLELPIPISDSSHRMNPRGSASPVTDGTRVVAWFGSGGVVAVGLDGKELWRADLGPQRHAFGYGSSPVLHDGRVYLNFGPGRAEFVVALDAQTGSELWRAKSPEPAADDSYGTWSTPLVTTVDGQPQVVVALRDYVAGLQPTDGREVWRARGLGSQAKASPVTGEGVVYIAGDLRSAELCLRLDGHGEVTETHRQWRESPARGRIGSSVIHRGHLYGARANGILDCLKLDSGDVVWEERLPGAGANSGIWSSPILVGDRLYVVNQGGDTVVLRAAPRFESLSVNSLGETCNASPIAANGDLFLRTWAALWCLRAANQAPASPTSAAPPPSR